MSGTAQAQDWDKGAAAYDSGDYVTALQEFKPLAKQGNALAQTLLGAMYEHGLGVPQDHKEAVRLYGKAAEQGFAPGQTNFGAMYDQAKGVLKCDAVVWTTAMHCGY